MTLGDILATLARGVFAILVIAITLAFCALMSSATPFVHNLASATYVPREPTLSIYAQSELATGAPARFVYAIEFNESSNGKNLNHPNPSDVGRFGLHETQEIHAERAAKWGEYDPNCPSDAARITGHLFIENRALLGGSNEAALCAHWQGPTGVRRDGMSMEYLERARRVL